MVSSSRTKAGAAGGVGTEAGAAGGSVLGILGENSMVRGRPRGLELRLRVGARVKVTRAEGPGARYALWLQGCALRCPGCCNPQLFDPRAGEAVSVAELFAEIRGVRAEIEGVTLLGGEPFEQAAGLLPLARAVKGLGLSVIAFSGFRLEELEGQREPAVAALLASLDVLVDGRYEAGRPERQRLWVGSTNQRFHYLSDRYSAAIERPGRGEPLRTLEVRLSPDGRLSANGWPEGLALRRSVGQGVARPWI